ncbi:hypothetical protein N0V82_005931 [Gnomoniopsis sp. IMI 355080]|nr:hypothetical protein N0V82_005931 [Gnomoniopsis sp. IMI 355080]
MRYTHLVGHAPPSPSKVEFTKGKNASAQVPKPRLPTSRHHHIRKTSISTTSSNSLPAVKPSGGAVRKPAKLSLVQDAIIEVDCVENAVPRTPKPPVEIKAWESYMSWLKANEEPGVLWGSSLCATFEDCLVAKSSRASECAARVDDVYWSFYLPLDPLRCHLEDRILSGYLLHVWSMFIELGKRIPHNDEGQDRLVELLRELVHLPPMEVRTWDGNDAPWTDLPTLDDALLSAWDDLYDPEFQHSEPESNWVNYFSFLGRLVAADITPDWWEIPATTLKEVLAEDAAPTPLTKYKTMALAEFMNQAGDTFFEWCMDSGILDVNKDFSMIEPLTKSPVSLDWYEARGSKGTSRR